MSAGIRIGIITRDDEDEAWRIAYQRFPEDRKGRVRHMLAMKTSDAVWYKRLSQATNEEDSSPYWLSPFRNYKTSCPYLVGSYSVVARQLAKYFSGGYLTLILDIPASPDDLHHAWVAIRQALQESRNGPALANGARRDRAG